LLQSQKYLTAPEKTTPAQQRKQLAEKIKSLPDDVVAQLLAKMKD
jgi:hypothetical protein